MSPGRVAVELIVRSPFGRLPFFSLRAAAAFSLALLLVAVPAAALIAYSRTRLTAR